MYDSAKYNILISQDLYYKQRAKRNFKYILGGRIFGRHIFGRKFAIDIRGVIYGVTYFTVLSIKLNVLGNIPENNHTSLLQTKCRYNSDC